MIKQTWDFRGMTLEEIVEEVTLYHLKRNRDLMRADGYSDAEIRQAEAVGREICADWEGEFIRRCDQTSGKPN